MKNTFIYKVLLAVIALITVSACDDREIVQVENGNSPIIIDLSAENLVLDKNFPNNPALTITWNAATYTIPTEVKYKVEVSSDEAFTEPYSLGTVAESIRTASYTVSQMNTASAAIGLPAYESGQMFVRVSSYLGNGDLSSVSKVTSLHITPYELEYPTFYLVGAASYVGWNSGQAQLLYKKENYSYVYTYMTPENFRFLGQAAWDPINYSIDNPGTREASRYFKQVSDNISFADEENMKFTGTAGIYKITINSDTSVQSLSLVSASAEYDYPQIYFVGSFNGWSAAAALEMTRVSEGVYEITTNIDNGAEFKFISTQNWDTSTDWGNILTDNANNSGFIGWKGDNSNIKFDGGGASYKITVNLKAGTYSIE